MLGFVTFFEFVDVKLNFFQIRFGLFAHNELENDSQNDKKQVVVDGPIPYTKQHN